MCECVSSKQSHFIELQQNLARSLLESHVRSHSSLFLRKRNNVLLHSLDKTIILPCSSQHYVREGQSKGEKEWLIHSSRFSKFWTSFVLFFQTVLLLYSLFISFLPKEKWYIPFGMSSFYQENGNILKKWILFICSKTTHSRLDHSFIRSVPPNFEHCSGTLIHYSDSFTERDNSFKNSFTCPVPSNFELCSIPFP